MQRALRIMSLMAGMAWVAGCGSGSSPSSPTLAAPTAAPKADIVVEIAPDAVAGPSSEPGYTRYVRFTSSITEAAGLGAHLNYVRGDFYMENELVDTYELTGARLIEETGSNRIEAGGSRTFMVVLRWNAPCDLIRTTFQFTDDKGYDHHLVGNISAAATAVAASPDEGEPPQL